MSKKKFFIMWVVIAGVLYAVISGVVGEGLIDEEGSTLHIVSGIGAAIGGFCISVILWIIYRIVWAITTPTRVLEGYAGGISNKEFRTAMDAYTMRRPGYITCFRLQCTNKGGRSNENVSVEMVGRKKMPIREGDHVQVKGKMDHGVFRAKEASSNSRAFKYSDLASSNFWSLS